MNNTLSHFVKIVLEVHICKADMTFWNPWFKRVLARDTHTTCTERCEIASDDLSDICSPLRTSSGIVLPCNVGDVEVAGYDESTGFVNTDIFIYISQLFSPCIPHPTDHKKISLASWCLTSSLSCACAFYSIPVLGEIRSQLALIQTSLVYFQQSRSPEKQSCSPQTSIWCWEFMKVRSMRQPNIWSKPEAVQQTLVRRTAVSLGVHHSTSGLTCQSWTSKQQRMAGAMPCGEASVQEAF